MSKFSEEFEKQHPTVGKLKKATKTFKKMKEEAGEYSKDKYWIHKDKQLWKDEKKKKIW